MVGTCTLFVSSLYVVIWLLSQSAAGHDCIQTMTSLRLSHRITRSSSGQKWRKWTLPAGCAKLWASTSPALPLAVLNEDAPRYPGVHRKYTAFNTHTQAITHIGTFLHLLLGLKKKKNEQKQRRNLPRKSPPTPPHPRFIYLFTSSSDPWPPFSRLGCCKATASPCQCEE